MRFIIYGAGGVGATIGGRLFQTGQSVVLIARGAHLAALQEHGLRLHFPSEELTLAVPVLEHPSALRFQSDDVVLLTMKTQDTGPALDALVAAGYRGPVVCVQNGVDSERQALRRFGDVYGVCVILPATFLEPGLVLCHSEPVAGVLDIGRYPSGVDDMSVCIAKALRGATFESSVEPDIMASKYAKLLGNLGNALDAAAGMGAWDSALMRSARAEGRAVYAAAGINVLSSEMYNSRMALTKILAVGDMRHQGSSSWQSLARGTGSIETDHLNGEITLLGRLHGVSTPVNAMLQALAAEMVRTNRSPGSYSISDLEARLA